jgi:HlyD family secretion protein
MIKNSSILLMVGFWATAAGCEAARAGDGAVAFQGIVEHEDRTLAFEVPGRVRRIAVDRGRTVEAGQVVAELDDSLERPSRDLRAAELRAAEAQVSLLRAGARREEVRGVAAELRAAQAAEGRIGRTLGRQRTLLGKGVAPSAQVEDLESELARALAQREAISEKLTLARRGARPEEIEAALARVDAARAGLATVEARLARYVLAAVTGGTILDVPVHEGEVVGAGAPIATLADTAHPYVDVYVPQGRLQGLRIGVAAKVRVDAHPAGLVGRIEDVGRTTEFTPRFLFSERERPNLVVRVRVRVDDPTQELPAGVPAFVTFAGGSR